MERHPRQHDPPPDLGIPEAATCLRCGYALRGLPRPVCPECGTPFDPTDPVTYKVPGRRTPLKPVRPPSFVYVVVLCYAALTVIVLRSIHPLLWHTMDVDLDLYVLGGPGWVMLPIILIPLVDFVRRYVQLRNARALGYPHLLAEFNRHIWRWRVLVVCIALFYVTLAVPWPAALRFYLSWPWFAARADHYLEDVSAPTGPQRVGLYHVEYIWGRGQGFVWFQLSWFNGNRYGIVRYDVPPSAVKSGRSRSRSWIAPSWYFERW